MQTKRPSSNFTTGNVPVFPAVLVKVPLLSEENAIRFTSSAKKRVLSLPLNSPKKTPASYRVTLPIKKPPSSKAIASPKATTPPTMKNDNSTVNRMFFMIIHLFVLFGFSSVKKKIQQPRLHALGRIQLYLLLCFTSWRGALHCNGNGEGTKKRALNRGHLEGPTTGPSRFTARTRP